MEGISQGENRMLHLAPLRGAGVRDRRARHPEDELPTPEAQALLDQSYQLENLVLSYVEHGDPNRIRELLDSPPLILLGKMSNNALRQVRNAGICAAAIISRAAIAGGLDHRVAFRLSDWYIQRFEALDEVPALEQLLGGMMVEFADRVRQIRYHTNEEGAEKDIFLICAEYVAQNIYAPIRAEELAESLGYSRSYLCSRFKRQAGISLTQYILQEKVLEAQRMLRFTGQSLSEIAALFAFSSQSHFQTVFKRVTGETPLAYRRRRR